MRFSIVFCANLNKKHWDRRIWQVGYRGDLIAHHKITGRPDYPVTDIHVARMRTAYRREFEVMRCLSSPYFTKEVERPYLEHYGSLAEQRARDKSLADCRRMPGEVKKITGMKAVDRKSGNIGNLLHRPITVEDSMSELIGRNRYD